MPDATVVVVGAGASGLSAAAALKRKGIDAVLETAGEEYAALSPWLTFLSVAARSD